jgi:ribosomal protein L18E
MQVLPGERFGFCCLRKTEKTIWYSIVSSFVVDRRKQPAENIFKIASSTTSKFDTVVPVRKIQRALDSLFLRKNDAIAPQDV